MAIIRECECGKIRGSDYKREAQAEKQRQQIENILTTPFVSKPEDVAKEIWNVVKNAQSEAIVGFPAVMAATLHRFLPGATDWLLQRSTKAIQ